MITKIEKIRHSLSHIMALAVKEIFGKVKFGIGPVIENGFYYDFDLPKTLKPEDLPKIEKKMQEILSHNLKFEKKEVSYEEAKKKISGQPFKKELLEEIKNKGEKISFYKSGGFTDLCSGPHVRSTKEINPEAFKLVRIAGAYWRGDEKNKMLQRIYGVAFLTKKELEEYLKRQKEIEERDHRVLNNELEIYSISEEVGAGLILWHKNGSIIRNEIENFWKSEHQKRGYHYIYTPHLGNKKLWDKSGHTKFYKENMYSPIKIDEVEYLIKPMNCPFHIEIFKSKLYSYRDLPVRFCELGTVYRYERAGTLHGLLRVRGFTQDDSHIFCRPDQLEDEIKGVIDLSLFMLNSFGFKKFEISLSVRDPKNKKKYLGTDKMWEKAESALENALKKKKLSFKREEGEAVFYGPKIDIKLIDSLGRSWQGPTNQVDFNLPEKFDISYINKKGKKERVVMIHRTVLGSMERFIGNLMEHYAGAFPVWLSPVQVQIIPVGAGHVNYAKKLARELEKENIRVFVDDLNETVGYKIRKAIRQKVPYMLVIGDKEVKSKSLAVRERGKKKLRKMIQKNFIAEVKKKIEDKK